MVGSGHLPEYVTARANGVAEEYAADGTTGNGAAERGGRVGIEGNGRLYGDFGGSDWTGASGADVCGIWACGYWPGTGRGDDMTRA